MPNSMMVIRDDSSSHRLITTSRDWGLLSGPMFCEGKLFSEVYGVYENFTVARGIPKGSFVKRAGKNLYNYALGLQMAIEKDESLLCHDYSYGFEGSSSRNGGAQSIQINGLYGVVSTRPSGYCFVELNHLNAEGKGRFAQFIDLRVLGSIQTDKMGLLMCYRRKAEMTWLKILPPLLEYLESRKHVELIIEHQDRV